MLLPPRDDMTVYVEFAAVYLELRYFAESMLSCYFPALGSTEEVDALLARDLDAAGLYRATRPSGAPEPQDQPVPEELEEWPVDARVREEGGSRVEILSERKYLRWMKAADVAAGLGNQVRGNPPYACGSRGHAKSSGPGEGRRRGRFEAAHSPP